MNPTYLFLDDPEAMEAALARLASVPALAVDLEADSLHSYREKTCLVQVSTVSENLIFDPLPTADPLRRLGAVLADRAVLKVLHGGDFDVRLFKRDYNFEVRNLFDTMIAAQFTGRERVGLAALLEELFGIQLDKRFQRADWSARPIAPDMLAYAALDTAHLLNLRDHLETELTAANRLHWVQEEFRLLEEVTPTAPSAPWCLDVKGASRLAPRQLAVLQALLEFRDDIARRRDRPPFKVLGTDLLLRWATTTPQTKVEVLQTPGCNRTVLERFADGILQAVQRGAQVPDGDCPRPPERKYQPLTTAQEKVLRRLKRVRQRVAEQLGLPPGLLVNTATLDRIARDRGQALAEGLVPFLKAWQKEAIGEELTRVLGDRGT